jgi:hypothetical protein
MSVDNVPQRILAQHGTIAVYALADGYIRLDIGPASMLLTPGAFLALAEVVAAAARCGEDCAGVLAGDPRHGAVWRCHTHRTLTLLIDRVALRLAPGALPALTGVCSRAQQTLTTIHLNPRIDGYPLN